MGMKAEGGERARNSLMADGNDLDLKNACSRLCRDWWYICSMQEYAQNEVGPSLVRKCKA